MWQELKRKRRFENDEMEKLFQRYVLQANKTHLTHLLGLLIATTAVMQMGLILIYALSPTPRREGGRDTSADEVITLFSAIFSIILYCVSLIGVVFNKKTNEEFLSYVSYALTATFMVLEITLSRNASNLWATVFFVYINYALLPMRLLDASLSGLSLSFLHIPPIHDVNVLLPTFHKKGNEEKVVNIKLLMSINVVGMLTHFAVDMAKRKAFSEIRQYVRAKITIQKETVRQQRLLMSVLPEHLIEEMKADLAEDCDISKRKIYIKTYEPVSILFADIVGFTSLADRSPGSKVVEILNDLYCSFDKLARRNRCMRIKLLGDCYYCVSGLPKPNAYHANFCVNMGLDIIVAINAVREKYEVDVDMRVGIHSGKVQCGVLGLKKWQFDVWSSDVTMANYMESGGMPGKVHISAATKAYLSYVRENYVIEPAFGGLREPMLKDIDTYFVSFNKSKPRRILRISLPGQPVSIVQSGAIDGDVNLGMFTPLKREAEIERDLITTLYHAINSRSIRRLKKTNCKSTVLRFKEKSMEKKYNQEPDRMLQSYFIAALVVYLTISGTQMTVMPRTPTLVICSAAGLVWMVFSLCVVVAWKYKDYRFCHSWLVQLSHKIGRSRNMAQSLAVSTVFICYIVIIIPMVSEDSYSCRSRPDFEEASARSLTPLGPIHENPLNDTCPVKTLPYPEHTLVYTILIMMMTGSFQIVMFMYKFIVMLVICTAYAILLMSAPYFMKTIVAAEAAIKYFLMIMALASFLLLMLIHSQQSEIVHRLDFVWKMHACSDTENAQELQLFNQTLIENILPAHVARHYLDRDRPTDELYHEECDTACILFAAITNFSFAETEDDEDKEHDISILHDTISDFDDLLNDAQFSYIEKIKCTGTVYMAASGLSISTRDSISNKHITAMAKFALRLLTQVQSINTRHGTNFGIKIGINMGPVVAGVIGASMPQYDIWGNTVNVASRMYSTGVENRIQVTQKVAEELLTKGFNVEKRGNVFVKGIGSMVTYFLNGEPSAEVLRGLFGEINQPPPDGTRPRTRSYADDSARNSQAKPSGAQSGQSKFSKVGHIGRKLSRGQNPQTRPSTEPSKSKNLKKNTKNETKIQTTKEPKIQTTKDIENKPNSDSSVRKSNMSNAPQSPRTSKETNVRNSQSSSTNSQNSFQLGHQNTQIPRSSSPQNSKNQARSSKTIRNSVDEKNNLRLSQSPDGTSTLRNRQNTDSEVPERVERERSDTYKLHPDHEDNSQNVSHSSEESRRRNGSSVPFVPDIITRLNKYFRSESE